MIYDYGPANFGDTNGNYVSYSPAAQQQTDLTLLRYHEKSYVNSTMGSIRPHLKKNRIKHSLLQ